LQSSKGFGRSGGFSLKTTKGCGNKIEDLTSLECLMKATSTLNHDILKVLIIDDETDICYLLSTLLKQKNLETAYVNTLSDATLALKNEAPEIIFLDNHLPDGLGMNYIAYLKINYPSSKIVMITAHDTAADRNKALSEGADYFIGKPFTRDVIYKTVEQLMN
jgi:two-component system, OmpR family, response regulator